MKSWLTCHRCGIEKQSLTKIGEGDMARYHCRQCEDEIAFMDETRQEAKDIKEDVFMIKIVILILIASSMFAFVVG